MKYIDKILIPNEKLIYEGKFALIDNWLWIVFSLGLLWLPIYLFQKTFEIAVTNNRVIGKKGIISRETIDFSLASIEIMDVKQSILGRIFRYGDIEIHGNGGRTTKIPALKNPEDFKQAISSAKYK